MQKDFYASKTFNNYLKRLKQWSKQEIKRFRRGPCCHYIEGLGWICMGNEMY
jgi:hypothetical protein